MKKRLAAVWIVLTAVLALAAPPALAHEDRFMHHDRYMARLAHCESTHRWKIPDGGLQIIESTWDAFGGERYADRAELATRRQQKRVGWRVMDGQGDEAWPYCGDAVRRH